MLIILPNLLIAIVFSLLAPTNLAQNNNFRQLSHHRLKRDFMFAAGNATDPMPICFQACNREWRQEFEREFAMNASDFYDFPFHPKVLDYAQFLAYCRLADRQTQCFIERCGDQSADRVFSPSNFLCSFKRQHFLRARPCLEEAEPISFLRCDQRCHPPQSVKTLKKEAIDDRKKKVEKKAEAKAEDASRKKKAVSEAEDEEERKRKAEALLEDDERKNSNNMGMRVDRAEVGKVFSGAEMEGYERELGTLCSFQHCYSRCQEDIAAQICSPSQAVLAAELVRTYVQWHSADLLDWHLLTGNEELLPESCAKLAQSMGPKTGKGADPVLRAMLAVAAA